MRRDRRSTNMRGNCWRPTATTPSPKRPSAPSPPNSGRTRREAKTWRHNRSRAESDAGPDRELTEGRSTGPPAAAALDSPKDGRPSERPIANRKTAVLPDALCIERRTPY